MEHQGNHRQRPPGFQAATGIEQDCSLMFVPVWEGVLVVAVVSLKTLQKVPVTTVSWMAASRLLAG
jgi:hypothetical protein